VNAVVTRLRSYISITPHISPASPLGNTPTLHCYAFVINATKKNMRALGERSFSENLIPWSERQMMAGHLKRLRWMRSLV
jgi:hypothetical protein